MLKSRRIVVHFPELSTRRRDIPFGAVLARSDRLDRQVYTLVVERDADVRRLYAEFLRQWGYTVEEAQDGPEGLAKAFSRHPDLIVTGTRLAGMNGFDLCRMLRLDHLTSSTPIVVVTSDTVTEARRAFSAGADTVLSQSSPPDALIREIERLLLQVTLGEARQVRSETASGERETHALDRTEPVRKRVMLNHVYGRRLTTEPETQPPALVCPNCYQPLRYMKSYIGGVSARHPEQWDYFECHSGCGAFQYRHRTRKLRQIG
jgi:CheY-like chemotaxis protein